MSWLLDGEPAVQRAVRTRLLGEPLDSPECGVLSSRLMVEGTVPAILDSQDPDGHWGGAIGSTRRSTPTVWNLIILAELALTARTIASDGRSRSSDGHINASGGFSTTRRSATKAVWVRW